MHTPSINGRVNVTNKDSSLVNEILQLGLKLTVCLAHIASIVEGLTGVSCENRKQGHTLSYMQNKRHMQI